MSNSLLFLIHDLFLSRYFIKLCRVWQRTNANNLDNIETILRGFHNWQRCRHIGKTGDYYSNVPCSLYMIVVYHRNWMIIIVNVPILKLDIIIFHI